MIVDHRTYTLKPGTINLYVKAYTEEGYAIQTKHLGKPLGWYVSHDIGELNQIVHLWQYDDLADRERRRSAMLADPAWQAYIAKVGQYMDHQVTKILRTPPGIGLR
jgi:hypothetical protein